MFRGWKKNLNSMQGFSIAIKPSKSGLYNVKAGRLWFRFSKMIGWRSNKLPPLLDSSIIPLEIVCDFSGWSQFWLGSQPVKSGKTSAWTRNARIGVNRLTASYTKHCGTAGVPVMRHEAPRKHSTFFLGGGMGKPWWLVGEWNYFLGV